MTLNASSPCLEDDPIFHWHLRFRANPGLPHGLPVESCVVHDGRRTFGEIWYRTYRTTLTTMDLSARLFVMLTTDCAWQILRGTMKSASPISCTRSSTAIRLFWNGTGPGVPGLLHRVRAFRTPLQPPARLQPGHGPILRITSSGTTIWFRLTTIFGRQMCAPCTRTDSSFAALHRLYRAAGFCESDLTAAAKLFANIYTPPHCGKFVAAPTPLCLRLTSHFLFDVSPLPSELYFTDCCTDFSAGSPQIRSHLHCWPYSTFAMASSSPTTSIPIQEPVFLQFLHDVHHAYLLLHRGNGLTSTYSHPQTLNPHLFPALTYGTNLTGSDRTTRTRPMPLLTQSTSRHPTSLRKKPLWMSCWKPISLNHINMLLPRHLKPFLTI